MATAQPLTHAFNVGEVSTAALARVDIDKLKLAAEIQENLLPYVIGQAQARPGTKYLGDTLSDAQARLLPFIFSESDTAMIELTANTMRVWVNDALVTRPSVTSAITHGTFTSSSGWTVNHTGNATASFSANALTLACPYNGGIITVLQEVTTSSPNVRHALRIVMTNGPVIFSCGSSSGADDYIATTTLDTGTHSLAFTPTGSYWIQFQSRLDRNIVVDSIAVEAAGVLELPSPYQAADLNQIRYDQSGDVIFLACYYYTAPFTTVGYQPQRIERRAVDSWSMVLYRTDDGPFGLVPTANVRLMPGANYGNTTLTSDAPFFTPDMVGSLFQLTHENYNSILGVGGDGYYTDPVEVNGIYDTTDQPYIKDRAFSYYTSGTWSGLLNLQRSITGPTTGFIDFPYTLAGAGPGFTTNQGSNPSPVFTSDGTAADNLTAYFRIGFDPGDYASGSATVGFYYPGYATSGICRVYGYVSSTEVHVEVLKHFGDTAFTTNWLQGAWSDNMGWPSSVCFFDGRLWWAGDSNIWGSVSDDFTSFDVTLDTGDAGPIIRQVATGAVNNVNWLLPLTNLIIGTQGAEVIANSNALDEPLTPTAFTLRNCSTLGSVQVDPVKVDTRGLFIQRSGQRVYSLEFSYYSITEYVSTNLSRLNTTIGAPGLIQMAVQREPDARIWMVRSDGQCVLLLYAPDEQIVCWSRVIAAASLAGAAVIESVCVLPDAVQDNVYFSVLRTINGNPVRFIEKLAPELSAIGGAVNLMGDAYTFFAGPITTLTGLTYLAGERVVVWGNGVPLGTFTVSGGGTVTLSASATNVCVGLPYTWQYRSAKLAYGAQFGTALLQAKKVNRIGLLLQDYYPGCLVYGPDFTNTYPMPLVEKGLAIPQTTQANYDNLPFPFDGSWDTDSRVCLQGQAPYPVTLLGLVVDVTTNERL